MLLIPTEVKPSPINGLGLFAKVKIKAGQRVWQYHPKIDRRLSPALLDTLPDCVSEAMRKYCYVNPNYPEVMVLCGDDARFANFGPDKSWNLELGPKLDDEYTLIAGRDIDAGEEITVSLDSDADCMRKLFGEK